MRHAHTHAIITILFIISAWFLPAIPTRACTATIVGAQRSSTGRILLWKHRDTSAVENFVARGHGECHDFVALFNAGDSLLREAWAGVNDSGFAIINTQSYNLAPDTASIADREGLVLAAALGRCASLSDFETLLRELPKPLGVQANFGVADSTGNAAWYETDDHGWHRFDISPDSLSIRTNFSCSGKCGAGLGRERFHAASALLAHHESISPGLLTDTVSKSFAPHAGRREYHDRGQYIPRRSTSASVVISTDGEMRVLPGYPPTSPVAYTATLDSIPVPLLPVKTDGWRSPAWSEALRLRDRHFRQNPDGSWIVRFPKPQTL